MLQTDTFFRIEIDKENLKIQENSILQLLGYHSNPAEPFVTDTIKNCIESSFSILSSKGGFLIKKINKIVLSEGILHLEDCSLDIHKIISAQLKSAEFIAVFFATIGKEVELLSGKNFREGDMLEGYIYNLIGSEAAESAAEFVHQKIKELAAANGKQTTNRFSPGYCKWNVQEQFKLFSLFPGNFKDIALTDSALMNPVKSVSGIIGIGENVKYKPYTCKHCDDNKCIYREKNAAQLS